MLELNRNPDNHFAEVEQASLSPVNVVENRAVKEPPLKITGAAGRYDHRVGNDDYTQAGNLYRLPSAAE